MKPVRGTEALLVWARKVTAGYDNVSVESWDSPSWHNGLAFCAIIHHFEPALIDFDSLSKENIKENNEKAFTAAEKLHVTRLLDADDMATMRKPDRKSVQLYVSSLYNELKDSTASSSSLQNQSISGEGSCLPKKAKCQSSQGCDQLGAGPSGGKVGSQPALSPLAAMVLADDESKRKDQKSAAKFSSQNGTPRRAAVGTARSQPGKAPLASGSLASNSQRKDQSDQVVKTDLLKSLAHVREKPQNTNNNDSSDKPQNINKSDSSADIPQNISKSDSSDKPQNINKSDSSDKPQNTSKSDSSDKPQNINNSDSSDKPQNISNNYSSDRSQNTGKIDSSDKPQNINKSDSSDRTQTTSKSDSSDKPQNTSKSDSSDKPQNTSKSDSSDKPRNTSKSDSSDKPQNTSKSDSSDKPQNTSKSDSSDKPQNTSKSDSSDKPQNASKSDSSDKPQNINKSDSSDKPQNASKSDSSDKPQNASKSDSSADIPQNTSKSDSSDKPQNINKSDSSDKPQNINKSDSSDRTQTTSKSDSSDKPQNASKRDSSDKPQNTSKSDSSDKPQTTSKSDSSDKPQNASKRDSSDKPQNTSKSDSSDKPQNASKRDSSDKPQTTSKSDSSDKPQTTSKSDSSDKPQNTSKSDSSDKPQNTSKRDSSDKPQTTSKSDSSDKPQNTSKSDSSDKPQNASKSDSSDKPQNASKSDSSDKPQNTSKSDSSDKPQNTSKRDSSDKPQNTSKSDSSDKPQNTSKRDVSDKPQNTSKSDSSDKPQTTSKRDVSDKPQNTSKRDTTDKPQTTSKSDSSDKPQTTSKRDVSDKPQNTSKRDTTDKPQTTSKRDSSDKPQNTSKRDSSDKPQNTSKRDSSDRSQNTSKRDTTDSSQDINKSDSTSRLPNIKNDSHDRFQNARDSSASSRTQKTEYKSDTMFSLKKVTQDRFPEKQIDVVLPVRKITSQPEKVPAAITESAREDGHSKQDQMVKVNVQKSAAELRDSSQNRISSDMTDSSCLPESGCKSEVKFSSKQLVSTRCLEKQADAGTPASRFRSQTEQTPIASKVSTTEDSKSKRQDQQDQLKADLVKSDEVRSRSQNRKASDMSATSSLSETECKSDVTFSFRKDNIARLPEKLMDASLSASKVRSWTEKAPAVTRWSTKHDGNNKSKDQQDQLVTTDLQKSSAEVKDTSQNRNSSDIPKCAYSPDTECKSGMILPRDITSIQLIERRVDTGMSASKTGSQSEKVSRSASAQPEKVSRSATAQTEKVSRSATAQTEKVSHSATAQTEKVSRSATAQTEKVSRSATAQTEKVSCVTAALTKEEGDNKDQQDTMVKPGLRKSQAEVKDRSQNINSFYRSVSLCSLDTAGKSEVKFSSKKVAFTVFPEKQMDVGVRPSKVRCETRKVPGATLASTKESVNNTDQQNKMMKADLQKSSAEVEDRSQNRNSSDIPKCACSPDTECKTGMILPREITSIELIERRVDTGMSASKTGSHTEKVSCVTAALTKEEGDNKDQQDTMVKPDLLKSPAKVKVRSQNINSFYRSASLCSLDTAGKSEVKFSSKKVAFTVFPEKQMDVGVRPSNVSCETGKAASATMASAKESVNNTDQQNEMGKAGLPNSSAELKDTSENTHNLDSSTSSLSQKNDCKTGVESVSLGKHKSGDIQTHQMIGKSTDMESPTDKSVCMPGSTGEKSSGSYLDWQSEAEKKLASLLDIDFDELEDTSDINSVEPVDEIFVISDSDTPSKADAEKEKDKASQPGLDLNMSCTLEENKTLSPDICEDHFPVKHKTTSEIKPPSKNVQVIPKDRLQSDIETREEMMVGGANKCLIDTSSSDPLIPPKQTRKVSLDVTFNYKSNSSGECAVKPANAANSAGHSPSSSSPLTIPNDIQKCQNRISATELQQQLLEIDNKLSELESRERSLEDCVRHEGEEKAEVLTKWFQLVSKKSDHAICGEKNPGTRA